MIIGASAWVVLVLTTSGVAAERWRWPQGAESVRIDTKVSFSDDHIPKNSGNSDRVQSDESPGHFEPASRTEGFYNRPGESGRYRVRTEGTRDRLGYPADSEHRAPGDSEGTLDSLPQCKCVSNPHCSSPGMLSPCLAGEYLCCYQRQKVTTHSELFDGREHERPVMSSRERYGGLGLHNTLEPRPQGEPAGTRGVLVGPEGPTGVIGPVQHHDRYGLMQPGTHGADRNTAAPYPGVLVGPGGPTGITGPQYPDDYSNDVMYGPGREQGVAHSASAQRGVLVGPGGPTGVIGPRGYGARPAVLVGPGGPTGSIGPYRTPGYLVGPGGPTRQIGAYGQRSGRRGILVGPGGPTGTIGPGRGLLVGPGGATGSIGPPGRVH